MSTQRLIIGNTGAQNINLATANTITLTASSGVNVSAVINSPAYQKNSLGADVARVGNAFAGANNLVLGSGSASALPATDNTIVGISSMATPATGASNIIVGNGCMAGVNVVASNNVCVGHQAGGAINSSPANVLVGRQAGQAISAGSGGNVYIGYQAGNNTVDGSGNVAIGESARPSQTTSNDTIAIGRGAVAVSNQFIFGGTANIGTLAMGGTTNTCDLGLTNRYFRNLYLGTSVIGASGTNNITMTGNTVIFQTTNTTRATVSDTAITTTIPIQTSAGSALAPTHSFSTDTDSGFYSGGAGIVGVSVNGVNTVNYNSTSITPATSNTISLGTASSGYADGYFFGLLISDNRPRLVFNMMAPSATTALTGAVAYGANTTLYPTATLGSVSAPLNFPGGAWGVFGNPGSNFYITFTNPYPVARTIHIDWSLTIQASVNLGFYSPYLYRSTTAPPFGVPLTFLNLWDNTQDPQLIKVVGAHQSNDRGSHNLSGLMFVPALSTLYIPLAIANGANAQSITLLSMNGSAFCID